MSFIEKILAIIKGKKTEKQEILIIDNRFHSLEFLKNTLCHRYKVLIAQDKDEGLSRARLYVPAMIILNCKLCKESTLDLCEALREFHETKDIPILVIAEKGDDSHVTEFYSHKIEGYFMEPFTAKEILNQIEVALNPRK